MGGGGGGVRGAKFFPRTVIRESVFSAPQSELTPRHIQSNVSQNVPSRFGTSQNAVLTSIRRLYDVGKAL